MFFGVDTVITGNQGYGVELEAASTATFGDGAVVSGNRAFDLVCSSGSVAGAPQGMHPDIRKAKCQTWTHFRGLPAWLEALIEPWTPTASATWLRFAGGAATRGRG